MGVLLVLSTAFPFFLLASLALPAFRPRALALAPLAALPALLAAALLPSGASLEVPWLFLGGQFGLDRLARGFLLFSAGMWLAAGIYARGYLENAHDPRKASFFAFFLGTMGGNLCLVPALDMTGYFSFFAVMSFCAYGLIVHNRTSETLFAGRIYIGMTVLGEVAAFGGLAWAALLAGEDASFQGGLAAIQASPSRPAILLLLFVGFGIKLGVLPLHAWLPLAHPAAPTPASAVLSGVMIKTGLLLWLRLVPFDGAFGAGAGFMVVVGLATAFGGALIGMTQTHPKSLLAYSSISQMGLVACGVGAALALGAGSEAVLGVFVLFATHHALSKSALFMGVGLAACELSRAARLLLLVGLGLCGAALAGAPLTTGFAAKAGLKSLAADAGGPWGSLLTTLLPLTGVTTMALMVRFLRLVAAPPPRAHGPARASMALPWALLSLAVLLIPLASVLAGRETLASIGLGAGPTLGAIWPPLLGASLALALPAIGALRPALAALSVPPGDLIYPVLRILNLGRALFLAGVARPAEALRTAALALAGRRLAWEALARRIGLQESFGIGVVLMTGVALGLAALLALG